MKTEIPLAKEHATKEFDWDAVPNSTSYHNRSHSRELKREIAKVCGEVGTEDDQAKFGKLGFEEFNAPAEYDLYEQSETVGNRHEPTVTERWKDDLGEYAHHIWEY